jgi:hypothetical protein
MRLEHDVYREHVEVRFLLQWCLAPSKLIFWNS